ncbi:hypothetical protein B5M42_009425 [Paenibacillus athensensis]|uniref:Uncharacterized protein n=1 Tax=Paenibacillus athensensis TaxID=1967502 RepID=A0A4Y8QAU1_9BACL|nr:hypothetical protein [Paenibacillus athensensis]MCD1259057.1 hypothetical protein [Paenibacillus athensensis]
METVKLSRIVMKLVPDLYESLTDNELESEIILWYGLDALQENDVMEIIQFSILEHHKDALYH